MAGFVEQHNPFPKCTTGNSMPYNDDVSIRLVHRESRPVLYERAPAFRSTVFFKQW
jgi:hypothetical protein